MVYVENYYLAIDKNIIYNLIYMNKSTLYVR